MKRFVALALLLMVLDFYKKLEVPKGAIQVVTVPIQYTVYQGKQNLVDWFSFFSFWRSGEARIKNLELRNLELVVNENKAKILEQENQELRKQLGSNLKTSANLQSATVLAKGQNIEIKGGSLGQTVVYLDNLVGRIETVSGWVSYVRLPTDSNSKIPVKVGKAMGLVMGQFNATMVLDRIAQNEEIKVDDLVLTSGEGGSYEPNLVVGKIKKIDSVPTDLFQKAQVTPLINFDDLVTVFVIQN